MVTKTAANVSPQSRCPYVPIKSFNPMGIVFIFELVISVFANTNSFQINTKLNVAMVTVVFPNKGIIMPVKILKEPAPSIYADSIIELGK